MHIPGDAEFPKYRMHEVSAKQTPCLRQAARRVAPRNDNREGQS